METGLVIPEKVLAKLTKSELTALEKYQGKPGLAITTQAQFFELFLNGASCDEIHRLNPNFPFGAIVRARIEGLWDLRKDTIVAQALDSVRERVEQTQIAMIEFNADLVNAAHKQFGDRLKKYIQTGDEAVLGDLKIESLKQYRDVVEMWIKLTGQDSKVAPRAADMPSASAPKVVERAPTPEEADAMFQMLLSKGK
jgi:hypothetical protein